MPPPVFALLDGGHFDDLPTQLARKWVFARSLFLGQGDRDVERFGPWLIAIVKPAVVGIVLGVVGDLPAIVFWSCPTGETEICGG